MSVPPVPALATGKLRTITSSDTRLHGRWLVFARRVWMLVVTCTLAIFFASIPAHYAWLEQ